MGLPNVMIHVPVSQPSSKSDSNGDGALDLGMRGRTHEHPRFRPHFLAWFEFAVPAQTSNHSFSSLPDTSLLATCRL